MKNRKANGAALSVPVGLTMALGAALSLTVIQAALLTFLITTGRLSEANIGYGIMVILAVTAFFSSLYAAARIKHQRLLTCLGTGALYWGTLVSGTALFFGGQFGAVWETGAMILLGSTLAVFCCRKGEPNKYRFKNKISFFL